MTKAKPTVRPIRVVHDFSTSSHNAGYRATTKYGAHVFGCREIKRAICAINILLQTDRLTVSESATPEGTLYCLHEKDVVVPPIRESRYPEGGVFSRLSHILDHATSEELANLTVDLKRFTLFLDVTNLCLYSYSWAMLDGLRSGVIDFMDDWEHQTFHLYFNYIPPKYKRL